MRHYCPHRKRDVDPDFLCEDGEFVAKETYARFLERTVADLERLMFLPDEVSPPYCPSLVASFSASLYLAIASRHHSRRIQGVLPDTAVPQRDIEISLRESIEELQARERSRQPSSAVAQKIRAMRAHLATVQADNERIGQRIGAKRHSAVVAPPPLAWIKTREALDDRPGVHSGAGYRDFVRQWAKIATIRRNERWGPILEYDGI